MKDKKVILITGASSGMGKETAEWLAKEGHIVYGGARRVEKMNTLKELGGFPLGLDVTKEETLKKAVEKIISEQGRIDVLINNAGFGLYGSVEDTSLEDARYQFEVNLFGLASLTKLVTPHMRSQKSGKIINISSMGGKIYTPLGAWYHATKHAVEGFSDCLRLELKQFGIDVVVIEPGIIKTAFGEVLLDPMVERSKGGAYEGMVNSMVEGTKEAYEKGMGSEPAVIAKTISKAIRKERPKTRYLVGKFAKPLVFIRNWFGDRVFDKAIMSQVK